MKVRTENRYFEKSILCAQYNRLICETFRPRDESGAVLPTELTNHLGDLLQEFFPGFKIVSKELNKSLFLKEQIRDKIKERLTSPVLVKKQSMQKGVFYWKEVFQVLVEELLPFSKHSISCFNAENYFKLPNLYITVRKEKMTEFYFRLEQGAKRNLLESLYTERQVELTKQIREYNEQIQRFIRRSTKQINEMRLL